MRCPNGTRKNKDGVCVPKVAVAPSPKQCPKGTREYKGVCIPVRCPNGTRKYKGECVPKGEKPVKLPTTSRCPKGSRKNKQGDCVPINPIQPTPIHHTPIEQPGPLEKAVSRIQRFMNRTKSKRREMYLKTICSEAGLCIALGEETLKIKEFFRNFSFDLVDRIKRIGAPSANGFVNEVRYSKRGYNAFAVLKSAASYHADNLMYEYRVGQFLNKMSLLFPCFLETYGLFKYKGHDQWQHMYSTKDVTPGVFRDSIDPQPMDLAVGCNKSRHMAILIQHIRGCQTFREWLTPHKIIHVLPILFQVYYPLFHMRKNFTHYDLHTDNVLLYEPAPGKFIQYHYHTDTGVISFQSPYIAKIIDYGRSYFKDGEDSKDIYDQVCRLPECRDMCGDQRGFASFPLSNEQQFYHIVSQKKNESHDLRFLTMVLDMVKDYVAWAGEFKVVYDHQYGTPERSCQHHQCDVEGVYRKLETMKLDNIRGIVYGEVHVYSDRPLTFRKI
jgi:hypothetical protein